ncbi:MULTISPECIES: heavy metal translocating P-type ATPase [Rhodopseudomonas]|uniref:P-type Zn(2+) transporter n=1 Tax=Rhodopseudomonas palustris TaxID=1076 RepID=A0A0D7ENR4_RHOPL|nr:MULTISPECIES: heavy metal translocating P-type ATPase [Rhodopseudomonas]KIZ41107.1 haloacid dehalogenase [Rhodopseudomonas palustris]MDF3810901.1 heavy metal translocating P-type ATPase [Rhodopseudomonas sp. BAL398]WOK19330.1 heavy metal translocating P-type ATPase [Rhodopseudomonas sp. BAL398]
MTESLMRRSLIVIALCGLAAGLGARYAFGRDDWASLIWLIGTVPVVIALAVAILRDVLAGRFGVDAVALLSMSAALGFGENLAASVVAVMVAGGNVLEDFAVSRAQRDLRALADRAPRIAHLRRGDAVADIAIDAVAIDDLLLVRSGEVVPVDGSVNSAAATLDESALTGEPIPVARARGDLVRSGTVNAGDSFEMIASASAGESTYAGIVRLVEAAQAGKSPFIRVADRFALLLLPVTVAMAGAAWWLSGDSIRALAVLVVATPCPLILAAPVAFVAGIAQAARRGILIKGGGPLEALARARTVLFDKTGTLTVGGARLVAIECAPEQGADEVLRLAASLEQSSQHVVASSIVAAAKLRGLSLEMPQQVRETHGAGLEGLIGGARVRIGSQDLAFGHARPADWAMRALRRASWRSALCVFVAVDDRPIGALLLADELRRETPRAVQALRAAGIVRIVMVTGDRAESAETIAAALDLDEVLSERAPAEKLEAVTIEQRLHPTLMVGDGINDAPALAAAEVGIAMGARGATASSEAADVVILVDRLDRVSDAVVIARRAYRIALQSIGVGMALSAVAMLAAAFGYLTPVAGALIQEAIDVAVILNALRALGPGRRAGVHGLSSSAAVALHDEHRALERPLDRLREITDELDDADPAAAVALIAEASGVVDDNIIAHERDDESAVYPRITKALGDNHGLTAMSRAHREIMHLARLLARLSTGLTAETVDRYAIRDAQRVVESIEALVRMHNAQEEDIYDQATVG